MSTREQLETKIRNAVNELNSYRELFENNLRTAVNNLQRYDTQVYNEQMDEQAYKDAINKNGNPDDGRVAEMFDETMDQYDNTRAFNKLSEFEDYDEGAKIESSVQRSRRR